MEHAKKKFVCRCKLVECSWSYRSSESEKIVYNLATNNLLINRVLSMAAQNLKKNPNKIRSIFATTPNLDKENWI